MTLVCCASAVIATLLFVSPPQSRRVAYRLRTAEAPAHSRKGGGWWLAGLSIGLTGLFAAYRTAGLPAVAVGTAVLIIAATSLRLGRQRARFRAAAKAQAEIAHASGVLAAQIRVGRVPAEALRSAGEDCPVLAEASMSQGVGGVVAGLWLAQSTAPGHGGLADLARAWQISTDTGAPMARSLELVSDALTADQALRMVVSAELAAPRATSKIMAVLPFCGVGLGYLIGGDPVAFLLSGPAGWTCLVSGVVLAAAGVLWIDALAQRAPESV